MAKQHGIRFLFAGTPEFASIPLQHLLDHGFRPSCVLTQPDRPAGRGRKLQASPVKQLAESAGIDVFQPATLRSADHQQVIRDLDPELMIVVAYGLLLPQAVLDIPKLGCWNIHASLLPRWRGAAPIQRAIEAGDEQTGVCIMQMDAGLDTGPVLHRKIMRLDGSETAGSLHDSLAELGAAALLECLEGACQGKLPVAEDQAQAGTSYASKLEKSEAALDWNQTAATLERRVRAFNPWPVAWFESDGHRTRVWQSEVLAQSSPPGTRPGDIIQVGSEGIDIATGDGILRLLELQPAGKRRMTAADYLNSRRLPASLAIQSVQGP